MMQGIVETLASGIVAKEGGTMLDLKKIMGAGRLVAIVSAGMPGGVSCPTS
jgi:hypothetical protein